MLTSSDWGKQAMLLQPTAMLNKGLTGTRDSQESILDVVSHSLMMHEHVLLDLVSNLSLFYATLFGGGARESLSALHELAEGSLKSVPTRIKGVPKQDLKRLRERLEGFFQDAAGRLLPDSKQLPRKGKKVQNKRPAGKLRHERSRETTR
jgi:hypothetical protein